jgi:hypothetical protein
MPSQIESRKLDLQVPECEIPRRGLRFLSHPEKCVAGFCRMRRGKSPRGRFLRSSGLNLSSLRRLENKFAGPRRTTPNLGAKLRSVRCSLP